MTHDTFALHIHSSVVMKESVDVGAKDHVLFFFSFVTFSQIFILVCKTKLNSNAVYIKHIKVNMR